MLIEFASRSKVQLDCRMFWAGRSSSVIKHKHFASDKDLHSRHIIQLFIAGTYCMRKLSLIAYVHSMWLHTEGLWCTNVYVYMYEDVLHVQCIWLPTRNGLCIRQPLAAFLPGPTNTNVCMYVCMYVRSTKVAVYLQYCGHMWLSQY